MDSGNEIARLAAEPDAYVDDQDPAVGELLGYHIESIEGADWALSRVADLELEISENESMGAEAIARIEARIQMLNEKAMKGVTFFRSKIAEWAELNKTPLLLKGGKKKSRAMVNGVLSWRKSGGGLEVVDPIALLAWAQAQPIELGLVRVKEEPALKEIKDYAAKHNLIPPGMAEKPEVDKLSIEAVGFALMKKGNGHG